MQVQKQQQVTFRIKSDINEINKVYILFRSKEVFSQNDLPMEMYLEKKENNMKIYKCSINIDPQATYYYRYQFQIKQEKNIHNMKEDIIRLFKFDNKYEHQIDEWNKQWNIIKLHWNRQEFLDEFDQVMNHNIQQQQYKKENQLTLECKRIFNNQESQQQLKFKQVQDDIIIQREQEFEVNIQQETNMNFIIQKINFINFGKLVAEQVYQEVKLKMMDKYEPKSQNEQIYQLEQTIQDLKKEFLLSQMRLETQYENLQNISSQNITEYTNIVNQMQSKIQELTQNQINSKFEQLLLQHVQVEQILQQYNDEISQELQVHLAKYQNSLKQLEQLQQTKQENEFLMENKQNQIEFLKNINSKLKQKVEESESHLNQIEEKLIQSENNNKEQKNKNEKNQNLLKSLYQKLKMQKMDLSKCKNDLSDIEKKLQESELKNLTLQQTLLNLKQQFDIERQQNSQKFEQIITQNEQSNQRIDISNKQELKQEQTYIPFDQQKKQQGLKIKKYEEEIKQLKEKIIVLQIQIQQFQISKDQEERKQKDQNKKQIYN